MKKIKNLLLIFILLFVCSFTTNEEKNSNVYFVEAYLNNNDVIVAYDDNKVNLSQFKFYHLVDNKFTNKIVTNTNITNNHNVLDITINLINIKNNIEINLLQNNDLITLYGHISDYLIIKIISIED